VLFSEGTTVAVSRIDADGCPNEAPSEAVTVPYTELAPEVLHAVVESYVLREGTDYGEQEFSLAQKVAHVIGRLERREAQIVFDPETDTVGIVGARGA
jgi:uncharacterized protein YheU (UPF0270 family)